jgi:hypothetical protein
MELKGTLNWRLQRVQTPMAGTVPTHLTTLRLRFGMVSQFQNPRLFPPRNPSKHSARLHFEDRKGRLQFMYGLSDFGVFANFVLQSLQQTMPPAHALLLVALRSPDWIRLAFP